MLDYNLETLAGPKCQSLQVKDPDKFNFYPKKLSTDILSSPATSIMSQSEIEELQAIPQFLVEEKNFVTLSNSRHQCVLGTWKLLVVGCLTPTCHNCSSVPTGLL
ncbi:uncharacterized protein MELLADRAFT_89730 [Melampsora larici-populina 98AG31]|uniref:Ubiquitin conjugation factor E4 core domain-containing protein n=1 Tax=Melampsora larici-populina (strain 98AG31 / pathotype 3-4-7) TaxID=747676 RepID=F4RUE9_MELLP|nr:uncharacterized protein MELLADRAFT_89730 [Melampsora larici-populina 98AG31]EGG04010.1 hypothetical protein MELLADRAFT_89730 [Melampsora larici-populina 98AG31]